MPSHAPPNVDKFTWDAFTIVKPKPKPKALTHRARLTLLLGGPGSGNFGHAGRPGEVGGSSGSATGTQETKGTKGVTFREPTAEEKENLTQNTGYASYSVVKVGEKKDGGKVVVMDPVTPVPSDVQRAVFGDRDPADIAGQMVEDLPGDLRVTVSYEPGESSVKITARGRSKDGYLDLVRTFTRHLDGTLSVHHDVFELPKAAQGKGLAKAVLADHYQTYRELGVDKVELLANLDRGGYAWAKFGFKSPRATAATASLLKDRITGRAPTDRRPQGTPPTVTGLTDTQKSNILALIDKHQDDPKLPWHVAGMVTKEGRKVGKEILHEATWYGELDMHDKESTDRFEHYVKGH